LPTDRGRLSSAHSQFTGGAATSSSITSACWIQDPCNTAATPASAGDPRSPDIRRAESPKGPASGSVQVRVSCANIFSARLPESFPLQAHPRSRLTICCSGATVIRAIAASQDCKTCDPVRVFAPLIYLVLQTPEYRVRETRRDQFPQFSKNHFGLGTEGLPSRRSQEPQGTL
jgi:hypothetical protein